MNDSEGLSELAALVTKPRVITPSLTHGHPGAEREVEVPSLVEPAATAAEPVAPAPRRRTSAPPVRPPRSAEGAGSSDSRTYVAMGPLTLRADQATWVRQLRIEALQAGADLAVTDLVRVALDRLRAHGADWSDLRADLAAEAKARTRRRGI